MSGVPKILGAGSILQDLLVHVSDEFLRSHVPGEKGGRLIVSSSELDDLLAEAEKTAPCVRCPGGSTANTVRALAGLGVRTSFLCKTGADPAGAFLRESFLSDGAGADSFKTDPVLPTGRCLCLISPDSERTMRVVPGAAGNLTEEDLAEKDFEGVTHLHAEGYLLSAFPFLRRIVGQAAAHACTVSFDLSSFEVVGQFRTELEELLRGGAVDVLFANETEGAAFSGLRDVRATLDFMAGFCRTAVVKTGADGAWIRQGGETFHIAAESVPVTDTTGAGDLWQAGFLYGFVRGRTPEFCGAAGAAMAGEVIRHTGAVIPASRRGALRERLLAMESAGL